MNGRDIYDLNPESFCLTFGVQVKLATIYFV